MAQKSQRSLHLICALARNSGGLPPRQDFRRAMAQKSQRSPLYHRAAMILANDFSLPAGMEEVFDALVDPEVVLPCLRGARRGARVDERTTRGELRLEVGGAVIPYRGTLRVEERDREAGALRLSVDAREGRGQGTARGEVEIRLRESGGTTRVALRSDLELEGRADRAGQAAVEAAVAGLVAEIAAGLAARLEEAPSSPPAVAAEPPPAATEAPAAPEPEPVIPGRVRIMTTEPIPAASVAPRDTLAETLAARPWLLPLLAAGLLLLVIAVVRRRRS